MTTSEATRLLEQFRAGGVSREKVLQAFQAAPVADLGFAQVDTHRALRKGFPEVIFGAGKTPEHVSASPPSCWNASNRFSSRASPPDTCARCAQKIQARCVSCEGALHHH